MSWIEDLLRVEPIGEDRFRGGDPGDWPGNRVFGGLVAGQALWAATAAVDPAHPVHSFHAYFLRPGAPGVPIDFTVDRIRDGRSFTTRLVTAVQKGEAIFGMAASFHVREDGAEYQLGRAIDVAEPDDAAPDEFISRMRTMSGIDLREMGPTRPEADGTFRSTRRVWLRIAETLPDDPQIHSCALAFLSDMGVVSAARPPIGERTWASMMGASVDHSLWFHREVRADQWLLYDMHAVANAHSLGLVRGTMHTQAGVLGVSMAQECLIRAVSTRAPAWLPGPETGSG